MCGHNHSHQIDTRRDPRQSASSQTDLGYSQQQAATRPCPKCSTLVQEDFVFCPNCGTELLMACPECHRAIDATWSRCAFCGTDLTPSD